MECGKNTPPASAKNETGIEPVDFLSGMRAFLETFVVDGDVPFLDAPVQWNANDFANDWDQARQSLTEAATQLAEITRQLEIARSECDECGEIGERDGYEKAVADIDRMTGGDGEYRVSLIVGGGLDDDRHTPDAATMKQRIADRFSEITRQRDEALAELEEARDELASPIWPEWARSISKQLETYGIEVDFIEGWDLPVELGDWLYEAVRIEAGKMTTALKAGPLWKVTYENGHTDYSPLNPGLGPSAVGVIVSVEQLTASSPQAPGVEVTEEMVERAAKAEYRRVCLPSVMPEYRERELEANWRFFEAEARRWLQAAIAQLQENDE